MPHQNTPDWSSKVYLVVYLVITWPAVFFFPKHWSEPFDWKRHVSLIFPFTFVGFETFWIKSRVGKVQDPLESFFQIFFSFAFFWLFPKRFYLLPYVTSFCSTYCTVELYNYIFYSYYVCLFFSQTTMDCTTHCLAQGTPILMPPLQLMTLCLMSSSFGPKHTFQLI